MRIDLRFVEIPDIELLKEGFLLRVIRIICQVRFRTEKGWTYTEKAILDTGAPTSVLPQDIWERISVNSLVDYTVGGIVPKEECILKGHLAEVECILHDDQNETPPISIVAFLAPTSEIPLVIGFRDLLTKFHVSFDYRKKEAWLEI